MFAAFILSMCLTYDQAIALSKQSDQETWRFLISVDMPLDNPRIFYACPVYRLLNPPKWMKPGYYQVYKGKIKEAK